MSPRYHLLLNQQDYSWMGTVSVFSTAVELRGADLRFFSCMEEKQNLFYLFFNRGAP
jgi:hypothetical protein